MADYHILGLFPDAFDSYFQQSLIGKAREKGALNFFYHPLRDWALDAHKKVDDKPYGGGRGMVFLPEVVCPAVRELKTRHKIKRVILTSPRGRSFDNRLAKELSRDDSLLFLCGRYEGVDQRAIDLVVDEEVSLGDYVISGGELAATVMIDAISRFVPGVVGQSESVELDSFEGGLLEHPHYTRPEVFENSPVPEVLVSGNHQKITEWRRQEALRITWQRRPDLLKKAKLTKSELDFVTGLIHPSTLLGTGKKPQ